MVTQLNKSTWIRGGGVRPTHFPPRGPMWRGVVPHVVLCDTCTVNDRKWKPYAHIRRTGYPSWMGRIPDKYYPATVCYYIWTATYADKTADTNIDGNDVHVTNTDENTFDDTIWGNKYLSLLIPAKFIRSQRSELPRDHSGANSRTRSGWQDRKMATSRGCWPGI